VKGGVEKEGVCGAATSLQSKAEQAQPLHISPDVVLDCTQGVNLKQSRIRDYFYGDIMVDEMNEMDSIEAWRQIRL
jgi:hypothetical protein